MDIVHSLPLNGRYENNVKKIDENKTDSKCDSITSLMAETRILRQNIRDHQNGLNPVLQDSQVQIAIDKPTWKRFQRYSKVNDSISEIINKLLDFYTEKRKQERQLINSSIPQPQQQPQYYNQ